MSSQTNDCKTGRPGYIYSDDVLTMWTLYMCPSDYPLKHVVRACAVGVGKLYFDPRPAIVADLTSLRPLMEWMSQFGLHYQPRQPTDDPCIMGVWF